MTPILKKLTLSKEYDMYTNDSCVCNICLVCLHRIESYKFHKRDANRVFFDVEKRESCFCLGSEEDRQVVGVSISMSCHMLQLIR